MTTPRFEKVIPTPPPKHEIVRDNATSLTWPVEFSSSRLTFEQAEKYIATLNADKYQGFDDWRLPTRVELLALIDDTLHNPASSTTCTLVLGTSSQGNRKLPELLLGSSPSRVQLMGL